MIALIPYTKFIGFLQHTLDLNPAMTIAFAHGTFNITNTIIQFPFIAVLAWIVTKVIKGHDRIPLPTGNNSTVMIKNQKEVI